jgi:oxygen-dependent protoporphyrinogen oxidase
MRATALRNAKAQVDAGRSGNRLRDCIEVGRGIADPTTAWNLRVRDVLLLDAKEMVGGRIRSEMRGDYWLSAGAHMFPEPESIIGRMVEETPTGMPRINGDLLGVWMSGKLVRGGRPETDPFRLPIENRARIDLVSSGLNPTSRATSNRGSARV